MTRTTIVMAARLALAATLPAVPAHAAARDRVFVASYGNDSNPCTFGSPCKTFQNAVSVVAVGGEVTAIDSAGFGTFTISHAVTITSPNGVEAGIAAPASGGAAITINAEVSDKIVLNGLTLDGDNVTGTTGIQFNSGGNLSISNSVIRNFATAGIVISAITAAATSYFAISNTQVLDNGGNGISLECSGNTVALFGVLDHVQMTYNGNDGLLASTEAGCSGISQIFFSVGDSVSANNSVNGIAASTSGSTEYKYHGAEFHNRQ